METGSVTIESTDYDIHPGYDPDTYVNDISVIHLPTKVSLTTKIRPACLPPSDRKLDDKEVIGE